MHEIIERSFGAPDKQQRLDALTRGQAMIACYAPIVVPVIPDRIDLIGPEVKGIDTNRRWGRFSPDTFIDRLSRD